MKALFILLFLTLSFAFEYDNEDDDEYYDDDTYDYLDDLLDDDDRSRRGRSKRHSKRSKKSSKKHSRKAARKAKKAKKSKKSKTQKRATDINNSGVIKHTDNPKITNSIANTPHNYKIHYVKDDEMKKLLKSFKIKSKDMETSDTFMGKINDNLIKARKYIDNERQKEREDHIKMMGNMRELIDSNIFTSQIPDRKYVKVLKVEKH